MVFCCKIHCKEGRSEAAARLGAAGLAEPPKPELGGPFEGAWM